MTNTDILWRSQPVCVIMILHYAPLVGVSPSGKANGSDPFIVGSNPATPATTNFIECFIRVGRWGGDAFV